MVTATVRVNNYNITFSEYSNPVMDSLKSNFVTLSGKQATCHRNYDDYSPITIISSLTILIYVLNTLSRILLTYVRKERVNDC